MKKNIEHSLKRRSVKNIPKNKISEENLRGSSFSLECGISFSVIVEMTDTKYVLLSKYLFQRT